MVIDDARLIQGLVKNLTDLGSLATSPETQAMIQSSRTMALELYRRADFPKMASRYAEGRALIGAAAEACTRVHRANGQALAQLLLQLPVLLPRTDFAFYESASERIRVGILMCLADSGYPAEQDPQVRHVIDAMLQWEQQGYAMTPPEAAPQSADEVQVRVDAALLQKYLRSHCMGYEQATVSACTPITGGFSKQTILFDVERASGPESLVYRGSTKIQIIEPVLVDIADEFHVVSHAYSNAIPVARPLWLQPDTSVTGTRFFISRRVAGANLGTAVTAYGPISASVTQALARTLAQIHALPLDSCDVLRKSQLRTSAVKDSLPDVMRRRIEDWRAYFRSLNAPSYPILEQAFKWLLENVAESYDDIPVLVHGDYGLHNILVHGDGVAAVLDWEACHLGDRALDLSHLFAGTVGCMDQALFIDAYVDAGGRRVGLFRLKYCQVLMSMQFMLSTIDAQHIFQRRAGAVTQFCTLGLGYIGHTATRVVEGISEATAARACA